MIDVSKIPNADVIAQRIFGVVNTGVIEQEIVTNILSDWNNDWIGIIAEQETGKTDNVDKARQAENSSRLKQRIDQLSRSKRGQQQNSIMFDNAGF